MNTNNSNDYKDNTDTNNSKINVPKGRFRSILGLGGCNNSMTSNKNVSRIYS